MTGYKTKVWDGTQWVDIANSVPDLSGYWAKSEYPGRNLLINGAMQLAQRNTSVSSITTSNYYTLDRWYLNLSSGGTWTMSQDNDVPTGQGFAKSLKLACTTAQTSPATTNNVRLWQKLEGFDVQRIMKGTTNSQPLTLSFWVKAYQTGTFVCTLDDLDNSRKISASYTINSSGVWEKKIITFSADTVGMFTNDNSEALMVQWWLMAGPSFNSGSLSTSWSSASTLTDYAYGQTNVASSTSNYFQITGVQLETGSTATPFEFEPYETTLRKCQRYYYKMDFGAGSSRIYASTIAQTTNTDRYWTIYYPVTLRANPSSNPTVTCSGTVTGFEANAPGFCTFYINGVAAATYHYITAFQVSAEL